MCAGVYNMKIVDDVTTVFSHQMRTMWHVVQDLACLTVCVFATFTSLPYSAKANNIFVFFTILTSAIFLFKLFRTDLYTNSTRVLGAWGAKYRCFYAMYYSAIAFLCASMGGFKGYLFAAIWIVSGGTYIVVANQIAKEEDKKKEEVAEKIEDGMQRIEGGCPYCHSHKYKEGDVQRVKNDIKIECTCKKCKKHWTEVYQYKDVELRKNEIPDSPITASDIF